MRSSEPRDREVDAIAKRVLAHVAADVRELHGDPEIDRVCRRARVGRAEERRHQETDGSGHAVAIRDELPVVPDPDRAEIASYQRFTLGNSSSFT